MGLGLLGRGLKDTLFLVECGARVTVTDLKTRDQLAESVRRLEGKPCALKLGGHDPDDFVNADMILRNADVPASSPYLELARAHGVPIEMDESLFCKHFEGTVAGITGTRGKTTTTTLIHRILTHAGLSAHLAGNILGQATLPLLGTASAGDIVVLELSSWQLQGFHGARLSPHAAVFTNIHPDHLNRYSGMDDYIGDKKAIYRYQRDEDVCVFNRDQAETARLAEEAPGRVEFFSAADIPSDWNVRLPGAHNRENVAAAVALTRFLGVSDSVIRETVEDFDGVEHRLQPLGEIGGVEFINDTTSTSPAAGCAALDALQGRRILLIAGGSDKKLDLTPFARAAAERAVYIALLDGSATDALHEGITAAGGGSRVSGRFSDLAPAVGALMDRALPGDVILLSPGCASFGMFANEYDRGRRFIRVFERLKESGDRGDTDGAS